MFLIWGLIGIVVLLVTLFAYGHFIEIKWFEITQSEIKLKNLNPAFDGYRIAHISDIHLDSSMTKERLTHVASLIVSEKPDLIVITGDFVSYNVKYVVSDLHDALAELKAPDGVVAVTGNHDHLSDVDTVRGILQDVGIHELQNDYLRIERNGAHFYLAGVDDVDARKARLDLLLPKLPDDEPVILLAHEPDFADIAAATGRFDLQLSGHTHAGQIRFPLLGILYGPHHGHRYQDGYYSVDDRLQLYVTRGVGTVSLPIRLNCRPEITILTLRSSE